MKYLEIKVKTSRIIHGFDENNKEIVEIVAEEKYINKLILVQRIQSISEDYILVTGSHGRLMYWEYDLEMSELIERLNSAGLVIG